MNITAAARMISLGAGLRCTPLAAALLGGCAVGPDFHRPAPIASRSYAPGPRAASDDAQIYVHNLDIPGQWWTLFHSEKLDGLITRALADNPSLQAAQAALLQSRETLYAQEGSFFPDITATFEPTRNKTATRSVSFAASKPTAYYSLITAQLAITYTPDLWGGTRRQVENLVAQADQQRFQLEATYLTLTSNVVSAVVNEASLRAQIAATHQIVAAETGLLEVLRKQYAAGQIAELDVLAQQAALAQAQGTLVPLQRQFDQQRDALETLLGAPQDAANNCRRPSCWTTSPCRASCRSACRRCWWSSGRTCARRKPTCTPPARPWAWPSPTACLR